MPVEIQVRTALQHLWAELSEKMADLFDPAIKYGGGSDNAQRLLSRSSNVIADYEDQERTGLVLRNRMEAGAQTNLEIRKELDELEAKNQDSSDRFAAALESMLTALRQLYGGK